jgi:hypothetical protein
MISGFANCSIGDGGPRELEDLHALLLMMQADGSYSDVHLSARFFFLWFDTGGGGIASLCI